MDLEPLLDTILVIRIVLTRTAYDIRERREGEGVETYDTFVGGVEQMLQGEKMIDVFL